MNYWNKPPVGVSENVPLAPMTTWDLGGPARFFAEPEDEELLSSILAEADGQNMTVYRLGGGSNLLITDEVLDGLVIRLSRSCPFGELSDMDKSHGRIVVGAAMPLHQFLKEVAKAGLSGLEDLAGIPGSVGGAVAMNAGNPVCGIGTFVKSVEALDAAGRKISLKQEQLNFAYRWSNLQNVLLTRVELELHPGDPIQVKADMDSFIEEKRERHPMSEKSAGCVFRNPPGHPAGQLIEQAGLKGANVGDALISEKHANFIVNAGKATCEETRALIDLVRNTVKVKFGIELQLEVKLWL